VSASYVGNTMVTEHLMRIWIKVGKHNFGALFTFQTKFAKGTPVLLYGNLVSDSIYLYFTGNQTG